MRASILVAVHPGRWLGESINRVSLVDEADSGASVGVPVTYPAIATAVPEEIHLRDEEPAAAQDTLDVPDMAAAAGPLHPRLEDHRGAGCGRATGGKPPCTGVVGPLPRHTQAVLVAATIPGVPRAAPKERAIGIASKVAHPIGGVARRSCPLADTARPRAGERYHTSAAPRGATAHDTMATAWHPGRAARDIRARRGAAPMAGAMERSIGESVA